MDIREYLTYQKNKVLAKGNTEREMELNRKSMEARDSAEMDKRVKAEQQRRVQLAREQARQEYDVKYATEQERIRYEKKIAQAKSGNPGGILGFFYNKERRPTGGGTRQPARRKPSKPSGIKSKLTMGDPMKRFTSKKKGKVDIFRI